MAARIIPFPKLPIHGEKTPAATTGALIDASKRGTGGAKGLHLVQPCASDASSRFVDSQQHALRIVEAICSERNIPSPRSTVEQPTHSPQFWAMLPIPPARAESPFAVARRLAHMLASAGELA